MLALDERTQQTSYQPVLQLIQNKGHYQFIKVTLENGEQLEATAEHPFYIQGKGWNAAANLKVGDALLLHNGTTLVIKTLDTSVRVDAVYNFTVANLHNYFVGKDGVGVHNAKPPKGECFRGGKKKQRDQWYGYENEDFQRWWHRQGKDDFNDGRDIQNSANAKAAFEYWVSIGSPTVK